MVDIGIVSLGAALMIAAAGACYGAASLRGDNNEKWGVRVAVTEAGLREIATDHLIKLSDDVAQRIYQLERIDPAKVIADPASMVERAQNFLVAIKALGRIQWQLTWLVALGPVFLGLLVLMELGLAGVFGHLGGLWDNARLYEIGRLSCSVSGALLIVWFILYAYLQHALSSAAILARPANNED